MRDARTDTKKSRLWQDHPVTPVTILASNLGWCGHVRHNCTGCVWTYGMRTIKLGWPDLPQSILSKSFLISYSLYGAIFANGAVIWVAINNTVVTSFYNIKSDLYKLFFFILDITYYCDNIYIFWLLFICLFYLLYSTRNLNFQEFPLKAVC